VNTSSKLLIAFVFSISLFVGIYFLKPMINTFLHPQKTVEMVIEKLKEEREKEFLESYPDLYSLHSIRLITVKEKQILEVWSKATEKDEFILRKTYPYTSFSGVLGPKLKEGDRQIPEGVYSIEGLNPNSKFHLSIKVGYPNDLDKKLALEENRESLGGDIFIHGKASTIGCIPIGDSNIEELFYLVATVKPIHSSIISMPVDFRLTENNRYIGNTNVEKEIYKSIRQALHHSYTNSKTFLNR